MDESVDIYAKFLGIGPGRRPPDYYARIGNCADRERGAAHSLGGTAADRALVLVDVGRSGADCPAADGRDCHGPGGADDADGQGPLRREASRAAGLRPQCGAGSGRGDRRIAPAECPANGRSARARSSRAAAGNRNSGSAAGRGITVGESCRGAPKPPDMPAAAPTAVKARLVSGPGTAFGNELPTVAPDDVPLLPPTAQPTPIEWHVEAEDAGPAPLRRSPRRRTAPRVLARSNANDRKWP